ncbi:ParA family protein [Halomonas caseinilytica]|uniref:ParA family protein n=1 Tax=Halomonas caseinilytica TaxID=438744 RepID=UPI0007E5728D|nr:ParA family protein [Halomonas caseinilytica]SEN51484.1 chromosome partitioning related protein ParA [Halomonas caseinilytica]
MRVTSIISSKGGVGKTTTTANLGGLLADAGYRVLLIDFDPQPTLSSYYPLAHDAPGGIYELIALNITEPEQIISSTTIEGLDLITSNDGQGQLPQLLHGAPDGRIRLHHLLGQLPDYDVILIDTQGARSIMLEAAILAADHALSPITIDALSAREFIRGTVGLLDDLEPLTRYTALDLPRISLMLNRLDHTRSSKSVSDFLLDFYDDPDGRVTVMDNNLKNLTAFRMASAIGQPIHRFEPRKPYRDRVAPAGADQIIDVASELNPAWAPALTGLQATLQAQGGRHEH